MGDPARLASGMGGHRDLERRHRRFMRVPTRVHRPGGDLWIMLRREDVEPTGGCLIGIFIWFYSRLRWQLSGDKRWEVSVQARHATRRLPITAMLEVHLLGSNAAAQLRAADLTMAAKAGDFDDAIRAAGSAAPRRVYG